MKKFTISLSILLSSIFCASQSILFTSEFGGENHNGAIMNYDLTSGQLNTFKSLGGNFQYGYNILINQGFTPVLYSGGLTLGQDGNYYGINEFASGIFNGVGEKRGIFYQMNAVTHESEILFSFTGPGAFEEGHEYVQEAYNKELGFPVFTVIETSPGVFWGLAAKGGAYDLGGVWKFDVNTNTYSKIGEFDENTIGYDPLCPMIIGPNNNLYGLLRKKGTQDVGYVYRVNTTTNVLELIGDLDAGAGWAISSPLGNIVYIPGSNKLYGVKNHFSGASYGGGIFSYDLGTNQTTNETFISLAQTSILGSLPRGMLLANDGNMYFVCGDGGAHNNGTIVKYTPGVNTMVKMKDFYHDPHGTGFHTIGPKIYGVYNVPSGSGGGGYAMWSFDVSSYTFQDIIPVSGSSPGKSMKLFTANDNGKLIGHFMQGGAYDAGSIFEYDISLGQTTVIQENASPEGRSIIGELCKINDSVLIGFTGMGGNGDITQHSELGNLIKVNIQTGNIEKLHGWSPLDQNDHTLKSTRPIYAANGKLYYGFLYAGNHGKRFILQEYDFNTNQYSGLFENNQFDDVISGPLEYNNNIILAWKDSVYVYDFNQQSFTLRKYSHDVSLFGGMKGNIMLASDGRIYGTTKAVHATPTSGHDAVIYSLDVTNFDFQVEHTFDNVVRNTNIGLTELNGKLWGSTNFGGANNQGYLFSYNLSNGTFTTEHSFNAAVDGGGFEAEWTPVNGKLYSTSYTGGPNGFGTLVEFDPSNSQLTVLENLTINNGRSWRGSPIEVVLPTIDSIVPNSGTQNQVVATTIYGTRTYFTSSSSVSLVFSNDNTEIIQGTIVSAPSDTTLVVNFPIPLTASVGLWDLRVDGLALDNSFTVIQAIPSISYMDPNTAYQGDQVSSEIHGVNTQWSTGPQTVYLSHHTTPSYLIYATNVTSSSNILLDAAFDIPSNALAGNYDLHVGNLILQNGFTVLQPGIPYLHSIIPDNEIQGNSVFCLVTGINTTFMQGSTPTVSLQYHANPSEVIMGYNVMVNSDIDLEVEFDIPLTASLGLYDLIVDTLILQNAFTVTSSGAQLTDIDPNSGYIGTMIDVVITSTGTQFDQLGVSSVMMKYHANPSLVLYAITYLIINDTVVNATFGFPVNTSPGFYDVHVDSYSLSNGFEVIDNSQQIISINPDYAFQGDFETVEIVTTGTLFGQQSPTISMSCHAAPLETLNAINLNVVNDTTIEATFGFPSNTTVGLWDVHVNSMTVENGFTVQLYTAIPESNGSANLAVFPNPFSDYLNINASAQINKVDLIDLLGNKMILPDHYLVDKKLKTAHLSPGIYILRVVFENGEVMVRKLVKEL